MEKDYVYLSMIIDIISQIQDKNKLDLYIEDNQRFTNILIENINNKLDEPGVFPYVRSTIIYLSIWLRNPKNRISIKDKLNDFIRLNINLSLNLDLMDGHSITKDELKIIDEN